jgi:hypothetical protein
MSNMIKVAHLLECLFGVLVVLLLGVPCSITPIVYSYG